MSLIFGDQHTICVLTVLKVLGVAEGAKGKDSWEFVEFKDTWKTTQVLRTAPAQPGNFSLCLFLMEPGLACYTLS